DRGLARVASRGQIQPHLAVGRDLVRRIQEQGRGVLEGQVRNRDDAVPDREINSASKLEVLRSKNAWSLHGDVDVQLDLPVLAEDDEGKKDYEGEGCDSGQGSDFHKCVCSLREFIKSKRAPATTSRGRDWRSWRSKFLSA